MEGNKKMTRKQICFTADNEVYKKLEKIREETGIPISKIIELALKGYRIVRHKAEPLMKGEYEDIIERISKYTHDFGLIVEDLNKKIIFQIMNRFLEFILEQILAGHLRPGQMKNLLNLLKLFMVNIKLFYLVALMK